MRKKKVYDDKRGRSRDISQYGRYSKSPYKGSHSRPRNQGYNKPDLRKTPKHVSFKDSNYYKSEKHYKSNSKNDNRKFDRNKQNVVCVKCKRTGHISKDCRVVEDKKVNCIEILSDEGSDYEIVETNTISAVASVNKLLTISCKLNGVNCVALIDSGSMISTISRRLVM